MTKTGFFAYPSEPHDCGPVIENAISQINSNNSSIKLESWKQLEIGGKLIISSVLNKIDSSDFFCADITGINENVLFELGFAIGKKKPIFLIHDTSIEDAFSRFKEFILLTGIGYHNYTKSGQIVSAFFKDNPHNSSNILLDNLLKDVYSTDNKNGLLYIKSQIDTDFSQYIIDKIEYYKLPVSIDDATENKIQPLNWYLATILKVPAVLIEFSQVYRTGHQIHNSKCSFIGGLSLGLGLRIQMIAAKPFPTSFDYQEYLKKFIDIESLSHAVVPFLTNLKSEIAQLFTQQKNIKQNERRESLIQKIKFGEYIAEHESHELPEYYLDTAYQNIIKSEYNIVVGRKGSGKTATLYYLRSVFSKDSRNLIIPIKPVNFEIDGLVEVIKSLDHEFAKGYIIQSVWKFLIYTEIAKVIYQALQEKPDYALREHDKYVIDFVEKNKAIILTDFSTRLEQELTDLKLLSDVKEQGELRDKISEILHERIIGKLKELIISYMTTRKKLIVIIDNLDKNWSKDKDIETTSKFILGLLGVIGRISKELRGNPKKPYEFDVHLLVLLRSDIFSHILKYAREPDKIEYTLLKWDDPEVLFRLVDARLEYLSGDNIFAINFWDKYVVQRVCGQGTKKYIISCIIPRPRDLIFFLNSAKSKAVMRGHSMIIEDDFISAHKEYSAWVFSRS